MHVCTTTSPSRWVVFLSSLGKSDVGVETWVIPCMDSKYTKSSTPGVWYTAFVAQSPLLLGHFSSFVSTWPLVIQHRSSPNTSHVESGWSADLVAPTSLADSDAGILRATRSGKPPGLSVQPRFTREIHLNNAETRMALPHGSQSLTGRDPAAVNFSEECSSPVECQRAQMPEKWASWSRREMI